MLYAIQTPYTCSLMSYFETYGNFVIEENKRPDLRQLLRPTAKALEVGACNYPVV